MGSYARGSTIGQAAKSGVDAARKYFGVGENQQAPTVTGLASSAKCNGVFETNMIKF